MSFEEFLASVREREDRFDADMRAGVGPDGAMRLRYIGPPMICMRESEALTLWLDGVAARSQSRFDTWIARSLRPPERADHGSSYAASIHQDLRRQMFGSMR